MEYMLQTKPKISRKAAVDKLCAFARFGNHGCAPRPTSNPEVEQFLLARQVNTFALIERLRDPAEHIPFFENLIGATWSASGGGEWSVVSSTGKKLASVSGPGIISMNDCQAAFETSTKARDRAINEQSMFSIYECLTFGIASIEAFFERASSAWNESHPSNNLIDISSNKVKLEDKITTWLPIMSGGKAFDKSNRQWNDFKVLKRIRDNHAIHPKGGQAMSLSDMAKYLNSFRHGIAHLLGNLHVILHCPVPAVVINAIYFPDVIIVERRK
jgi:hypothetical protein